MLVLSRRQNEKIVFPNLGISVSVVRIAGRVVRLGIEAPQEVRVVREELAGAKDHVPDFPAVLGRQMRHALRNRLNSATLGLQLLRRRLQMDQTQDADAIIRKIFHELHELNAELDASRQKEQHEHSGSRKHPHTGNHPGAGIHPASRNRRALVVEDNANEGQLLAEFLRVSGYDVDLVDDGLQAIAYLREHQHPDVVLLDMCMPQLDGPQTVASIRREPDWRGLKLFAVSGADRRELGVECGPDGVDRWFSKPIDARELVNEMNRDLDASLVSA